MPYPASSLSFQKNKYYVVCTIPKNLRPALGGRRQIKRSTGTSDEKIARGLQHNITAELYAEFSNAETALSPVHIALQAYLVAVGKTVAEANAILEYSDLTSPHALEDLLYKMRKDHVNGPEFEQAKRVYLDVKETAPEEEPSNFIKFSELSERYIESKNWQRLRTRQACIMANKDFIKRFGDIRLDKVTKKLAYDFADQLGKEFANKTVRNRITYVAQAFHYAETQGLTEDHPFKNMKLSGYGKESEPWKKFEDEQLIKLFAQKLPKDIRLALAMLITTGMRLDEVALLTHEDIKVSKGIKHFDLTGAIVKNRGSQRLIPIIPELDKILPAQGQGRLFDFPVDRDGKASVMASRRIMPWIRNVTSDDLQVVHSLRGTLKDLLRDVGVSKEINDFLTGHAAGDAAGRYGDGPSLQVRYDALNSVEHPWL